MTLAAHYKFKKDLKAAVGEPLKYEETSVFEPEYKPDGKLYVVGSRPYDRKWYAEVWMKDGLITGVE